MANTVIQLKRSVVSGNVPLHLLNGELALNSADGILFYKDDVGSIKQIKNSKSFSVINVNSTLLVSTSPDDILNFTSGNGITVSGDFFTDTVTITGINASTSQKGVVQLYDNVLSNSISLAATANSVNTVHELANLAYTIALSANAAASGSNTSTIITSYKVEQYIATEGQTTFSVTNGYTVGYISVYVNGILLDTSDYVATNGTTVVIYPPLSGGDSVSIAKWYFDSTSYLSAIQNYDQFTATANQTLFVANTLYTPGYIKAYRNGILLENSEITATDGANVILSHAATANDVVTLHYWGASGISATPVYLAANAAILAAQDASDRANTALSAANGKINVLEYANLFSVSVTTSANTANQILDIFSSSTYRSVKYQIQVSSGTDYQTSEVSLIHNGSNSYITEYGLVSTNSSLINYDTDISGGNVRLLMSPVNPINTIKFVKTSIVV